MRFFKKTTEVNQLDKRPREYSLKDYDDTYALLYKCLMFLGIRVMRKDSYIASIFWLVFYCFEYFIIWTAIVLNALMFRHMMQETVFDTKILQMLPCIGYVSVALIKSYKIVTNRQVIENIIGELKSMWPQGAVSEQDDEVISKALKEIYLFSKAYHCCNCMLLYCITLPPYVGMLKRALGYEVPKALPYNYWTPYDYTQPGWFEFTITLSVYQTFVTIGTNFAGDLLFCVLLSHITTQFDLLCIRIQRLFYVPTDKQLVETYPLSQFSRSISGADMDLVSEEEQNLHHQRELIEVVVRHKALIRLSNDMENMFSFTMFYNFFYSSIMICTCGFCIIEVEKWNEVMYKLFFVVALSQTWVLCWYGEKLIESSQRVSEALYNSGWYTTSVRTRKYILIMMARSQKSVHMTTYGFSIICLSSYSTIIKSAWSYLTLLRNTYNK